MMPSAGLRGANQYVGNRLGLPGLLGALYLGFAIIYWLPGFPVSRLSLVKLGLAFTLVAAIFSVALLRRSFSLPAGLLGPLGFAVIILVAAPGLFQGSPAGVFEQLQDFVLCFLFLWCFYNLAKNGGDVTRLFRLAVGIVTFFALLTLSNLLLGWPNWTAPYENTRVFLHLTGFNMKRTGWSNGLALFFPLVALFLVPVAKTSLRRLYRVFFHVAVIAIIGSQLVCGGRAGLLASIVSGCILLLFSPARKAFLIVALTVIAASLLMSDYLFEHLRLYRLATAQMSVSTLDSFSAGRMGGYLIALELIAQRPLLGHGFGRVVLEDFGIGYTDVHNLWLRLAAESGILLPVTFGGFIASLVARVRSLFRDIIPSERLLIFVLSAVVLNGVVVSMFEPNSLIGTFQNSAVWWAAVGVLLGMASRPGHSGAPHPGPPAR